jgi:UDP-GlcNAc:undecaprenyl-phosphate/decaprenyl-phosphate GlcNAc-1-phosphate transferase
MYEIILAFITAFCLTFIAIPSIIHLAKKKNLVDIPDERRSHQEITPSLGGIGIFAGMLFSILMWTPFEYFGDLQYILCAFIIIFLIGAKDDIDPISPGKKFLGEILAASILVFKANIRLTSFYGIFGFYEIPTYVSILLSIFTIIVIINAFNLIDGINGLSASIGILISLVLGYWFFQVDRLEIATIASALIGSTLAFLRFNITPAKIFMGDTGALLIGLVSAILSILFIELHKNIPPSEYYFPSAPSFVIATLILPLFDTLRVFTLRIIDGKSPFHPDRRHIHHLLIDLGFTHMRATGILVMVNVLFILLAISLQGFGNLNLILIVLGVAMILSQILSFLAKKKKSSIEKVT